MGNESLLPAGDVADLNFAGGGVRRAGEIRTAYAICQQTFDDLSFLFIKITARLLCRACRARRSNASPSEVDAALAGDRMRHHSQTRGRIRCQRHDQAQEIAGSSSGSPPAWARRAAAGTFRCASGAIGDAGAELLAARALKLGVTAGADSAALVLSSLCRRQFTRRAVRIERPAVNYFESGLLFVHCGYSTCIVARSTGISRCMRRELGLEDKGDV